MNITGIDIHARGIFSIRFNPGQSGRTASTVPLIKIIETLDKHIPQGRAVLRHAGNDTIIIYTIGIIFRNINITSRQHASIMRFIIFSCNGINTFIIRIYQNRKPCINHRCHH